MLIALFLHLVAHLHQDIRRCSNISAFSASHRLRVTPDVCTTNSRLLCCCVVQAALGQLVIITRRSRIPLGLHLLKVVPELRGRRSLLFKQVRISTSFRIGVQTMRTGYPVITVAA